MLRSTLIDPQGIKYALFKLGPIPHFWRDLKYITVIQLNRKLKEWEGGQEKKCQTE